MNDETPLKETSTSREALSTPPSLEGTLRTLWDFWSRRGCLYLPPCDFALPAGTLHPEIVSRLLSPEPFRAMLLQPVRRPLDARRGEHPFHFSRPLQLVVMLQPAPGDGQDLFMESLEAVGVHLPDHDLTFAESPWRSHFLDAEGPGWSARLDGLGVSRLTYIKRCAGRDTEAPTFEITYGLERLLLIAHGGTSARENPWSPRGSTYDDLRHSAEEEHARYVLETADSDFWRQRIEGLEGEAERCLEAGLPRTAYEVTLRGLLGIDILTARGALTPRQREMRIDRLQDLVIRTARRLVEPEDDLQASADAAVEAVEPVAEPAPDAEAAQAEPPTESTEAKPQDGDEEPDHGA